MKTTEEGNKLIAEFMGHIVNYGYKKDAILYMPQGDGNASNNSVYIPLNKLKYHSSCDWLMPVAAKLINGYFDDKYEFGVPDLDDLMEAGGRFDLEEIYTVVVGIIEQIKP